MTTTRARLHITPFSAELVKTVLPPSLLEQANNLSYHTIQTFPENSYGFVELPQAEADKLKRKLQGAILKGRKMQIEDARPSKRRRQEDAATREPETSKATPVHKTQANKKDTKAIEGRDLSPDRKIKRGWTKAEDGPTDRKLRRKRVKGDQSTSKYSEKDELLFRAQVPPNKRDGESQASKKTKKTKSRPEPIVVHEFEKTTKRPTFLRDDTVARGSKPVSEYVDGKGWVDAEGQVVESAPKSSSRMKKAGAPQNEATSAPPAADGDADDFTSSSGSDAPSESSNPTYSNRDSRSPESDPSQSKDSQAPKVHPLEALFKKPSKPNTSSGSQEKDVPKPSLEVSTSFSFFGDRSDEIEAEEDDSLNTLTRQGSLPGIPLTPYSSQDMRTRTLRSAAPTPDTAHPSRMSSYERSINERLGLATYPDDDDDGDDDEGSDDDEGQESQTTAAPRAKGKPRTRGQAPSEFEKEFWEKRGDNDRAWKQRRRETLKEKRKAENRARRRKDW